ncbi:MAG: TIGR02757 family protein [Bergeyella cardium]
MNENLSLEELRDFLNEKVEKYNCPKFVETDPIQIPHRFELKQDIEISAFLTAIITFGKRSSIIKSADKMLDFMGNSPYDFVMDFTEENLERIGNRAIHRTFSMEDFRFFLTSLRRIYSENESMENLFLLKEGETNFYHALERFRSNFFGGDYSHRSTKHIGSTYKNSAAKRLMMFLRWLVRKDNKGVDLGIWSALSQQYLSLPFDVHVGNISRQLGILERKQNDWKAVEELDKIIRTFDANDPAKYDFALFGLGAMEDFN